MDDSTEEEWAVSSWPKRSKKENSGNCIIHCTDDSSPLVKIQSFSSWQTLLQAARVRQHRPLLDLSETLEQNQAPDIHYHRRCRSIFTLKKSLKALRKTASLKKFHARKIPSRSALLDDVCIFCKKEAKYHGRSKEKLIKCVNLNVIDTVREAANIKQDFRILFLLECHDLVAANAHYHKSCYKTYTRQNKNQSIDGLMIIILMRSIIIS